MTEEIPEQYWPRCSWCRGSLGEASVKIKRYGMIEERQICSDCETAVEALIEGATPYILGLFLSKHGARDFEEVKRLRPDEIEVMARQRMEEASPK